MSIIQNYEYKSSIGVSTMRPVEKFNMVLDCIAANIPLPIPLHTWIAEAGERWRNGESLADALGIYDSATERQTQRNLALKEYSTTLDGGLWQRSETIAKEIRAIRQGRKNASPMLRSIDTACKVPSSTRQIYNILKL
jgi:hypothetical protein